MHLLISEAAVLSECVDDAVAQLRIQHSIYSLGLDHAWTRPTVLRLLSRSLNTVAELKAWRGKAVDAHAERIYSLAHSTVRR